MAGDSADLFINVKGMGWAKLQGDALKAGGALKGITVTAKQTTKTLKSGAKVISTQYTSALKTGTAATKRFGKGLNSLAMRFVGLQAIVTTGMQKFRELHQWIGSSIEKFREFENRIAEVSTILQGTSMNLLPALQSGIEDTGKSLKTIWTEEVWPGILYAVTNTTATMSVPLGEIKDWLTVKLPLGLTTLRKEWVDNTFPKLAENVMMISPQVLLASPSILRIWKTEIRLRIMLKIYISG